MTSRSPLVNRLAVAIGAIVLTAIVSMATTLGISSSIEGNATAINQAGALRMAAFQLAARSATTDLTNGDASIEAQTASYQNRLETSAIVRSIPRSTDHPLALQYQKVKQLWLTRLKPEIEQHEAGTPLTPAIVASIEQYTSEVDQLVAMLEQRTEARIDLLLIQIISMIFSILIVMALFLDLKNRVLRPLRKLIHIATAVGVQDFSHKANLKGDDELARLGQAFDQMTSELALTYYELESRVQRKTEELEISH